MLTVVPRLKPKLLAMEFVAKSGEQGQIIEGTLDTLVQASHEVRNSRRFKIFMRDVVLQLGNRLNVHSKQV